MSARTVVRGGRVLTMDEHLGDFDRADVVIEDGLITAVTPAADVREDDVVIDAKGCIVIPGFVDGHRHLWQTFLRGALPNCTLPTYMRDLLGALSPHVEPEDGYVGTLLGALECLNAGITTVLDWSHALSTPEDSDARISALLDSGIRAYFAPNTPASAEWYSWQEPKNHPDDIRRLRAGVLSADDGLVRLAAGLRSPGQVPDSVVTADWGLARGLGLLISIHAGTRRPGATSYEADALARLGLLGDDVHFAHGNEFSDTELKYIADAGATLTLSPCAELTAGLGSVRPARLVAHGIRPGLSADATAMAPGDMFSQMRAAFAAGRSEQLPADPAQPYQPTFEARDVLDFATLSGARAVGLGDVCGSLSIGKDADIVLIRGDAVNTAPVIDPVGTVVVSADTSNVDTVLVAGKVVKHRGALVGTDIPALVARAEQARDRVLRAAKWQETIAP